MKLLREVRKNKVENLARANGAALVRSCGCETRSPSLILAAADDVNFTYRDSLDDVQLLDAVAFSVNTSLQ